MIRLATVGAVEVIEASELGDARRIEVAEIFVDGFYQWLHYFGKDKARLARGLAHIFDLDRFHAVVEGTELLGVAACVDPSSPAVHFDRRELIRHLGPIRGTAAFYALRSNIERHDYPFPVEPGCGSVEFVATHPAHRGRGVASALVEHFKTLPFDALVLEVADTNTNAVRLYGELGFREILRVPEPNTKRSGINEFIYMRYEPTEDGGR